MNEQNPISWYLAILPIAGTMIILLYQTVVLNGPPHIALVIGISLTAILGLCTGKKWTSMQKAMLDSVAASLPVLGIFMVVGMTISSWIASGTVPLLSSYGLSILSPEFFLPVVCIICALISVFTGTSWGTVGTIGLALLGIGESMGVASYLTAGAIVSGAWFGDKLSPLSDTTNFTAAITGTDLYVHIRNMLATTIPSIAIALIVYFALSKMTDLNALDDAGLHRFADVLSQHFNFGAIALLPMVVIALTIWRKLDPISGIFCGVVAASLLAMLVQGMSFADLMETLMFGYQSQTQDPQIDQLLSKGGIMSMTWVITLIMIAMALGGILEITGCFASLLNVLLKIIKGRKSLVFVSMFSVLSFNCVSNAFIAYTLPGRMLSPVFRGQKLSTANASRILEDGATMTAPLIPWNSGAVFVSSTLGVPTLMYAPFAIANWTAPLINLLWAVTGLFMPKAKHSDIESWRLKSMFVLIDSKTIQLDKIPEQKYFAFLNNEIDIQVSKAVTK